MVTKRELQKALSNETMCEAQYGRFPCNTCFHAMKLGKVSKKRLHDYWLAVLKYRGDYSDKDMGEDNMSKAEMERRVNELYGALMEKQKNKT